MYVDEITTRPDLITHACQTAMDRMLHEAGRRKLMHPRFDVRAAYKVPSSAVSVSYGGVTVGNRRQDHTCYRVRLSYTGSLRRPWKSLSGVLHLERFAYPDNGTGHWNEITREEFERLAPEEESNA